tara:strand:+ start:950 stop:1324 length:375 start_codon:yes stop_codon:yes gene_type:complete
VQASLVIQALLLQEMVVVEFDFHQHSKIQILLLLLVLLVHLDLIGLPVAVAVAEMLLLVVVEVVPFPHHMPGQVKEAQEIQQQQQRVDLKIQDPVVAELEVMIHYLMAVLVVLVSFSSHILPNK